MTGLLVSLPVYVHTNYSCILAICGLNILHLQTSVTFSGHLTPLHSNYYCNLERAFTN